MKKTAFLLFIFWFLAGCKLYYTDPYLDKHSNLNADEKKFIAKFENAVVKHKKLELLEYLDEDYRAEQFEQFYSGDLKAFWNDFFCGKDVKMPQKYRCLKLSQINEIHLIKVDKGYAEDEKLLKFKVGTVDYQIIVELILKVRKKDGKNVYGIVGAYG